MNANTKGILFAAVSSATFGFAPFFSVRLLHEGFSPFEVLAYRWGIASLSLGAWALLRGERLLPDRSDAGVTVLLSLFRAATSLSLVFAYANIASGAASTIHFLYPLAVAACMMLFFGERASFTLLAAIATSIAGAVLLSSSDTAAAGGDATLGLAAACVSVFSYAGYIVGVRKTRAAHVQSTALTFTVMGMGALLFAAGGAATSGIRIASGCDVWLDILGLALPATAVSNITLVKAVKLIGPTRTSVLGALEPLTAVAVGAACFGEAFTPRSAAGVALAVGAVMLSLARENRRATE